MSIETFVCTCCGESVPMDQRTIFLMGRSCAHNAWSKKPFYVSHAEHEFGVTITPEAITHLSVSPALIATIPIARAAVLSCTLKTQDTTDTTKMKKNLFYTCYMRHSQKRAIQDYYYKPLPLFYGKGKRYFGVELEIDCGGEDDGNAHALLGYLQWWIRQNLLQARRFIGRRVRNRNTSNEPGIPAHRNALEGRIAKKQHPWGTPATKREHVVYMSMSAVPHSVIPRRNRTPVLPVCSTSSKSTGKNC